MAFEPVFIRSRICSLFLSSSKSSRGSNSSDGAHHFHRVGALAGLVRGEFHQPGASFLFITAASPSLQEAFSSADTDKLVPWNRRGGSALQKWGVAMTGEGRAILRRSFPLSHWQQRQTPLRALPGLFAIYKLDPPHLQSSASAPGVFLHMSVPLPSWLAQP